MRVVYIPALAAVLKAAEDAKGAALTKEEVLSIRDRAARLDLPVVAAEKVIAMRGYSDIDPARAWQDMRAQFQRSSEAQTSIARALASWLSRVVSSFRR